MNKGFFLGRITKDIDLKYSSKDASMAIARYTVAVDTGYGDKRRTDFINCVAFGKAGEFANKYFVKGMRVLVSGNIKIGSYENKSGTKIPTFDLIIETQEFADGKREATDPTEGFTPMEEEQELPFV